jgi:hypothetical protein
MHTRNAQAAQGQELSGLYGLELHEADETVLANPALTLAAVYSEQYILQLQVTVDHLVAAAAAAQQQQQQQQQHPHKEA